MVISPLHTAQEDTSYEAFKFRKEYQEWLNTKED